VSSTSYGAMIFVALLFASSITFCPTRAHAQECIEMYGARWDRSYVGVYIAAGTNEAQRKQVLFALQVWLAAQQWFIDSYMSGTGVPWFLYLADNPDEGSVSLSFFIGQGVGFGGRAMTEVLGRTITRSRVEVNLPPDRAGNPDDLYVESVILHELGHALGLGHSQGETDAMNGAVDTSPRNYGLPSTLDLYALYKLSQAQQAGELGRTVCLIPDIGYGIPPWVERTGDRFTLRIPISMPGWSLEAPVSYPQTVGKGEDARFTTLVRNTGSLPFKVVSLSAEPDFGPSVQPNEQLPVVVDPNGERQLTHTIRIPDAVTVGTHNVRFIVDFVPLTLEGWSSEIAHGEQTASFEVTEPQVVTGGGFTVTVAENPLSTEKSSKPEMALTAWVIPVALLLIALAVLFLRLRSKPRSQVSMRDLRTANVFCTECGAENPTTNQYCGKCGKPLVANPIHE